MKILLLIFYVFSSKLIAQSQVSNIKIVYDVILNEASFKNTNSSQYSTLDFHAQNTNLVYEKLEKYAKCYLEFNAEEDVILKSLIGINSPIYFDYEKKQRLAINKGDFVIADGTYLIEYPAIYHWEILNESKQINNYTCYKAVLKSIDNSRDTYFPVTAWFCPDLPINAGFSRYNGLPGMVLELHEQYLSYMAQTITYNKSDVVLPILPIVSLEDHIKEVNKLKKEKPGVFQNVN